MILTSNDANNVGVICDLVQAKYLVSLLRNATEDQMKIAAKEVFDCGFDDGTPVNALAAARSFTNIIGFVTDSIKLRQAGSDAVEGAKQAKFLN